MKFIGGLVLGLVLGVTGSSIAAQVVGEDGWLTGFDVTLGGEIVCSDPYVYVSHGEIGCG